MLELSRLWMCKGARSWVLAILLVLKGTHGPAWSNVPPPAGGEFFDPSVFISGAAGKDNDATSAYGTRWNGRYQLDASVNQKPLGTIEVGLAGTSEESVAICVTLPTVRLLNIKPAALRPAVAVALGFRSAVESSAVRADSSVLAEDACLVMGEIVAGGGARFDSEALSVALWFPQAYALGAADADLRDAWADSATVGVLGYSLSAYQGSQSSANSRYMGITARLSAGNWGFQHTGSATQSGGNAVAYETGSFSASTGIARLHSTLALGSLYMGGGLFDGAAIEGAVLATDVRMLPASQRAYAPVIRGEAIGNATVEVWQFGKRIYSMNVPPGPFVIDKLNALGFGGELSVIVKEADGSQRATTVPYAPPVDLLPEGSTRYSLAVGEVTKSVLAQPALEVTYRYGLDNLQTLQAGLQWSEGYSQLLIGSSFSTKLGALGINLRRSELQLPLRDRLGGDRMDVNWTHASTDTPTRLNLTSSWYSNQNFYDLSSALGLRNAALLGTAAWTGAPIQRSLSATFSYNITAGSSLYLSGTSTTRWSRSLDSLSYQVGYSIRWGKASVTLSAMQYQFAAGPPSNIVSLGFSMPLDFGKNRTFDSYTSMQQDPNGDVATSVGVAPRTISETPWSYGLGMSDYRDEQFSSGNLAYRGAYATLNGSASGSSRSGLNQLSLGASGAVLAHGGGVSFAPSVGDTFAIVQVERGEGVRVYGTSSVVVDSTGYAVVPNLNPYSVNTLELDTADAEPGLFFEKDSYTVVPRAGTGVLVRFAPRPGWPALIRGKLDNGRPLPFAAELRDSKDQLVGYVGQGGQIQAHLTAASGLLYASWGDGADKTCALPYRIPETGPRPKGTMRLEGVCTVAAHSAPPKEPEEAKDTTPPTVPGAAKVVSMNTAEASP